MNLYHAFTLKAHTEWVRTINAECQRITLQMTENIKNGSYLVCPDSFKGSLDAHEAAEAIAAGILEADKGASVDIMPLADGGEGTARILGEALGASCRRVGTADALGRDVVAEIFLAGCGEQAVTGTAVNAGRDGVAIMDVASAIGLGRLEPDERDIMHATSRGAGLLVAAAVHSGAHHIIIGLGGTATCDGGMGMREVMRQRLRHEDLAGIKFTILCDVDNPFYGEQGAAYVFAPQKGATPEQVKELDGRLRHQALEMAERTGVDVSFMPGAGAAGGIAGMMAAEFGAELTRGIDVVLETIGFNERTKAADAIFTGEGRIDSQTPRGKTLSGVCARAYGMGKPVVAFGGQVEYSPLLEGMFSRIVCINKAGTPAAVAMNPEHARKALQRAAFESCRALVKQLP